MSELQQVKLRGIATLDWLRSSQTARRWGTPMALALAVLLAALGTGVFVAGMAAVGWPDFWFEDLQVLTDATAGLFAGDGWYLDRQLQGPYQHVFGEVLYPPVAAWFFLPWLVLPAWTFVAIPVAIIAWHVIDARPAPWTWPLLAFGATFPITLIYAGYANPTIWIAAFAALGLRYRWPGALVLLKPSLVPFALIGIRSRGWWLCVALLALGSLPFLELTLQYPQVVFDMRGGGLLFSSLGLPIMLVPVVAWLGRRR